MLAIEFSQKAKKLLWQRYLLTVYLYALGGAYLIPMLAFSNFLIDFMGADNLKKVSFFWIFLVLSAAGFGFKRLYNLTKIANLNCSYCEWKFTAFGNQRTLENIVTTHRCPNCGKDIVH